MNLSIELPVFFLSLCLIFSPAFAATDKAIPRQIIYLGADGEEHYHRVYCSDGKHTTLVKTPRTGEVCAYIAGSESRICKKNWHMDTAALKACK